LTAPILSRFDLLAVVKDEVDADYDDALATFVINSHMKNHPSIMNELKRIDKNEGLSEEQKGNEFNRVQEGLN